MRIPFPSIKALSALCALGCVAMLGAALFLQFHLRLHPCPLCVIQRLVFVLLGLLFLIGALHMPSRVLRRIYYGVVMLVALFGVGIAGRQVWLQQQTLKGNEIASCGADLEYMIKNFPLSETIKLVLSGTGECGKIQLTILSHSIPEWTAVVFAVFAIVCVIQMARPSKY